MRKIRIIQIGFIVSVLFIAGYAWMGYNYLTVMNWLLNQNNLLALCFGLLALYNLLLIGYQLKLNQVTKSKNYYMEEAEEMSRKYYNKKEITTQIEELKKIILKNATRK